MPAAKQILCIDVGGSGLKAAIITPRGRYVAKRVRIKTPKQRKPRQIVAALVRLVAPLGKFDHVTIGFPGAVKHGKVISAPNFGTKDWKGFGLAAAMQKKLKKPVKRLGGAYSAVPYSKPLENAFAPNAERIAAAALALVG